MTEEKPKKKKLRAIGVQLTKSMVNYGKAVEKAMNDLADDGYSVELHHQPGGVLITGALMQMDDEGEGPPRSLREVLARLGFRGPHVAQTEMSPRSDELFRRFGPVWRESPDMDAFAKLAKEKAQSLVKGFDVNELTTAVNEFEKEAASHEKKCANGCEFSVILRHLVSVIKDTAKEQLQ